MSAKVETRTFIEFWYLDGTRYVTECKETGISHDQICPLLLKGVFAYRFFQAKQVKRPCGACLRVEPGKPSLDDEVFFYNCALVGVYSINDVKYYALNRVGELYSFLEGDTLILNGQSKNGFVNKTYVRKGNNVEEAFVS